jgi:hypothetical protein
MAGNFPGPDSKFTVAVVTDQQASDHSGNQSFYSPIDHGEGVNVEDMMLSPMFNSPTAFMQQAFPGAMDPGTPVVVLKQLGELGGIILGQSNTVKKGGENQGGAGNLGSAQKVSQLSSLTRNINIAPDIQEVEENGVKIRKIVEKGQQHALDLLDGLPVHGALFDMAGFRLPEITNVPTAKQTNDGMASLQSLQQMMGQVMSLGQMIQGLAGNKGAGGGAGGFGAGGLPSTGGQTYTPPGANTGAGGAGYGGGLGNNIISAVNAPSNTPLYTIMEGMTPPMRSALNSLSTLLQGYSVNGGVAFMTGDVVHEDTYLQNAQELLSQVTSLQEMMYVLNRLQWDKSLFGQEKLANVVNQIETAWGVALQEIDVNGNIVVTYGLEDANLEMEFANTMTSNTGSPALGYFSGDDYTYSVNATGASQGFPSAGATGGGSQAGGGGGTNPQQVLGQVQGLLGQIEGLAQGMSQNMFGESAGTMKDMWKRMTREQENDAKQMHDKLNTAGDAQEMSKIIEKAVKGGNPIDPNNLKPNQLESMGDFVGEGNFGVGTM